MLSPQHIPQIIGCHGQNPKQILIGLCPIALTHCIRQPSVQGQAFFQFSAVTVMGFDHIAQHQSKALKHNGIGGIPRQLRNGIMESVQCLRQLFPLRSIDPFRQLIQHPTRCVIHMQTRKPHTLPLHQNAELHKATKQLRIVQGGIIIHNGSYGQGRGVLDVVRYKCPLSRNNTQKAHALQIQNPLVHAAAADPQFLRQFPLGRQSVTGLQLPR